VELPLHLAAAAPTNALPELVELHRAPAGLVLRLPSDARGGLLAVPLLEYLLLLDQLVQSVGPFLVS